MTSRVMAATCRGVIDWADIKLAALVLWLYCRVSNDLDDDDPKAPCSTRRERPR